MDSMKMYNRHQFPSFQPPLPPQHQHHHLQHQNVVAPFPPVAPPQPAPRRRDFFQQQQQQQQQQQHQQSPLSNTSNTMTAAISSPFSASSFGAPYDMPQDSYMGVGGGGVVGGGAPSWGASNVTSSMMSMSSGPGLFAPRQAPPPPPPPMPMSGPFHQQFSAPPPPPPQGPSSYFLPPQPHHQIPGGLLSTPLNSPPLGPVGPHSSGNSFGAPPPPPISYQNIPPPPGAQSRHSQMSSSPPQFSFQSSFGANMLGGSRGESMQQAPYHMTPPVSAPSSPSPPPLSSHMQLGSNGSCLPPPPQYNSNMTPPRTAEYRQHKTPSPPLPKSGLSTVSLADSAAPPAPKRELSADAPAFIPPSIKSHKPPTIVTSTPPPPKPAPEFAPLVSQHAPPPPRRFNPLTSEFTPSKPATPANDDAASGTQSPKFNPAAQEFVPPPVLDRKMSASPPPNAPSGPRNARPPTGPRLMSAPTGPRERIPARPKYTTPRDASPAVEEIIPLEQRGLPPTTPAGPKAMANGIPTGPKHAPKPKPQRAASVHAKPVPVLPTVAIVRMPGIDKPVPTGPAAMLAELPDAARIEGVPTAPAAMLRERAEKAASSAAGSENGDVRGRSRPGSAAAVYRSRWSRRSYGYGAYNPASSRDASVASSSRDLEVGTPVVAAAKEMEVQVVKEVVEEEQQHQPSSVREKQIIGAEEEEEGESDSLVGETFALPPSVEEESVVSSVVELPRKKVHAEEEDEEEEEEERPRKEADVVSEPEADEMATPRAAVVLDVVHVDAKVEEQQQSAVVAAAVPEPEIPAEEKAIEPAVVVEEPAAAVEEPATPILPSIQLDSQAVEIPEPVEAAPVVVASPPPSPTVTRRRRLSELSMARRAEREQPIVSVIVEDGVMLVPMHPAPAAPTVVVVDGLESNAKPVFKEVQEEVEESKKEEVVEEVVVAAPAVVAPAAEEAKPSEEEEATTKPEEKPAAVVKATPEPKPKPDVTSVLTSRKVKGKNKRRGAGAKAAPAKTITELQALVAASKTGPAPAPEPAATASKSANRRAVVVDDRLLEEYAVAPTLAEAAPVVPAVEEEKAKDSPQRGPVAHKTAERDVGFEPHGADEEVEVLALETAPEPVVVVEVVKPVEEPVVVVKPVEQEEEIKKKKEEPVEEPVVVVEEAETKPAEEPVEVPEPAQAAKMEPAPTTMSVEEPDHHDDGGVKLDYSYFADEMAFMPVPAWREGEDVVVVAAAAAVVEPVEEKEEEAVETAVVAAPAVPEPEVVAAAVVVEESKEVEVVAVEAAAPEVAVPAPAVVEETVEEVKAEVAAPAPVVVEEEKTIDAEVPAPAPAVESVPVEEQKEATPAAAAPRISPKSSTESFIHITRPSSPTEDSEDYILMQLSQLLEPAPLEASIEGDLSTSFDSLADADEVREVAVMEPRSVAETTVSINSIVDALSACGDIAALSRSLLSLQTAAAPGSQEERLFGQLHEVAEKSANPAPPPLPTPRDDDDKASVRSKRSIRSFFRRRTSVSVAAAPAEEYPKLLSSTTTRIRAILPPFLAMQPPAFPIQPPSAAMSSSATPPPTPPAPVPSMLMEPAAVPAPVKPAQRSMSAKGARPRLLPRMTMSLLRSASSARGLKGVQE